MSNIAYRNTSLILDNVHLDEAGKRVAANYIFCLIACLLFAAKIGGDTLVTQSAMLVLEYSEPGAKYVVRKYVDRETGKIWLESDCGRIESFDDLSVLRKKENKARYEKVYPYADDLLDTLANVKPTARLNVLIYPALNADVVQVKNSPGLTMAEEKKDAAMLTEKFRTEHLKAKKKVLASLRRTGVMGNRILSSESESYLQCELTKNEIVQLAKSGLVSAIELGSDGFATILACNEVGVNADIATLGRSAYNPEWEMPIDARGGGVNCATFEFGVNPDVKQCFIDQNWDLGDVQTATLIDGFRHHTAMTFTCMMKTAPYATHHHKFDREYDLADMAWIQDYDIEVASRSGWSPRGITTCDHPEDPAMRDADCFQYIFPRPLLCNPTGNSGVCRSPIRCGYNGISVGNSWHFYEGHYMMKGFDEGFFSGVSDPKYTFYDTCGCRDYYPGTPCQTKIPNHNGNLVEEGHIYNYHCTQAHNLVASPSWYTISSGVDFSNCGAHATNTRSDWEMPNVVATGTTPWYDICGMTDHCVTTVPGWQGGFFCGSSLSAPVTAGVAACVIGSDGLFNHRPERTKLALILTAHNVHGGHFDTYSDGIDGTGTISGADAVAYARNCQFVVNDWTGPVIHGLGGDIRSEVDRYVVYNYKIQVPTSFPAGKHLRIALVWTSVVTPSNVAHDPAFSPNYVPDFDLTCNKLNIGSFTYNSNMEVLDISQSSLTPGEVIDFQVHFYQFEISSTAIDPNYVRFAVGWTWVADHAG